MADNPFEDPDVQANSGPPPAPQQNQQVYGDDNAYDEAPAYQDDNAYNDDVQIDVQQVQNLANQYIPQEQQQQMAISAGSAVANKAADNVKADYNNAQKTQADQHEAPPPPTFCIKMFNWFPLRLFSFFGGILLIGSPILDLAFAKKTPAIQFFIYVYLVAFGVITSIVESPTWKFSRFFQLKLFFWFRLLSRMWGRAWFYLFVSILCYGGANSETGAIFTVIAGVYITIISILSFIFSRLAGKKFARMREYIAAGTENEDMEGRFMRKFDELDNDSDGNIGSAEIVTAAAQAARELTNSERHAIQTFLDESCNGYVSKEDWMKQFVTQYQENGFKQRFL